MLAGSPSTFGLTHDYGVILLTSAILVLNWRPLVSPPGIVKRKLETVIIIRILQASSRPKMRFETKACCTLRSRVDFAPSAGGTPSIPTAAART
jgi:hypothetical protein